VLDPRTAYCRGVAYGLGVDLGTTYSAAAAALSAGGRAEILTLGSRSPAIPSVLLLREHGEVLAGEAADRRSATEPGRTARAFKRRFGDPTPLFLGGVPYGAEALTAHLLRAIVGQAVEQQGGPPGALAVTHPATFGAYKLDLLRQAVQQADAGDAILVPEPVAAAVHYASTERVEVGRVLAVYDFGGGTFDVAVLRRTEDGFEIVGEPSGLDRLGGVDLDEAILNHVDQSLGGALRALDLTDAEVTADLARLRAECQLAKEALSDDTDTSITVALPSVRTEVRLTRAELEAMLRPRLGETVEVLERVTRSASLGLADLSTVLLVGGTSRIPLVRQFVRETVGIPVSVDAHPKHSIALGAAVIAARSIAPVTAAPAPATTLPVWAAPMAEGKAVAPEPVPVPEPATGEPLRRRKGVVLACLALLIAGGVLAFLLLDGGDDVDTPAVATTIPAAVATTIPAAGATTTAEPAVSAGGSLDLPRSVSFGGVEFSINELEVNEGDEVTPPVLWLRATGRNTYDDTTVFLTPLVVELAVDGQRLRGTLVGGAGVVEIGRDNPFEYRFNLVPDELPDLDDAVLHLSNVGDEPLTLPLGGDAPEPEPEPTFAPPAGEIVVPFANLAFAFEAGSVSRNMPVELGSNVDTTATRAGEGQLFVRLQGTVTGRCPTTCPGGALATSSIARLVTDGSSIPPFRLWFNDVVADGQRLDIELVFEVPAGADQYVLRFESGTGESIDTPLTVPSVGTVR
jgi:actin-like ATPase involved in cell morphogenesis